MTIMEDNYEKMWEMFKHMQYIIATYNMYAHYLFIHNNNFVSCAFFRTISAQKSHQFSHCIVLDYIVKIGLAYICVDTDMVQAFFCTFLIIIGNEHPPAKPLSIFDSVLLLPS